MSAIFNKMLELYDMAEMNDMRLGRKEKLDLLKATIALQVFERAMRRFVADEPKVAATA